MVDPQTLAELPPGEVGEIVTHGPQVFAGYWKKPEANAECFVEIDGKRFFRTGDLGRIDEDGYFFLVDRLKRMINASGFKVWPAEVEAMLYAHPSILEAAIISHARRPAARREREGGGRPEEGPARRARRGRAHRVVPGPDGRLQGAAQRGVRRLAAEDGSGKIFWRALQEQEDRSAS